MKKKNYYINDYIILIFKNIRREIKRYKRWDKDGNCT